MIRPLSLRRPVVLAILLGVAVFAAPSSRGDAVYGVESFVALELTGVSDSSGSPLASLPSGLTITGMASIRGRDATFAPPSTSFAGTDVTLDDPGPMALGDRVATSASLLGFTSAPEGTAISIALTAGRIDILNENPGETYELFFTVSYDWTLGVEVTTGDDYAEAGLGISLFSEALGEDFLAIDEGLAAAPGPDFLRSDSGSRSFSIRATAGEAVDLAFYNDSYGLALTEAVAVVPEPASGALAAIGLGLLAGARRLRGRARPLVP